MLAEGTPTTMRSHAARALSAEEWEETFKRAELAEEKVKADNNSHNKKKPAERGPKGQRVEGDLSEAGPAQAANHQARTEQDL